MSAARRLIVRTSDVLTEFGPLAHAIDGSGNPSLLIPVAGHQTCVEDWQNRAVTFGQRTIKSQAGPQEFLVLQCREPRLLGPFCLLVDDILEAASECPQEAPALARDTLERWKELLRDTKPPLLSDAQLVGLLGELTFLDELTFHNGADALRYWLGPRRARHDFVFASASVEVKATVSRESFTVTIHGSKQLEAPPGGTLFIRGYQFESSPVGTSVPQLLYRLVENGLSRYELFELVEKMGYSEADAGHYAERRYTLICERTSLVDESFPRLTQETVASQILDQITGLQYSVDLASQRNDSLDIAALVVELVP
ncbi:PD-(D/E)XK motif protein [Arthrobacter halodurans]